MACQALRACLPRTDLPVAADPTGWDDFFARKSQVPEDFLKDRKVRVPPLRERAEDIPLPALALAADLARAKISCRTGPRKELSEEPVVVHVGSDPEPGHIASVE